MAVRHKKLNNMANPAWKKGKSANPATQFKKGVSGNPLGKPKKIPNIDKLLGEVLSEEKDGISAAFAILASLRNKAIKGDVNAAKLILERAYGKPKQFIEQINKNEVDLTKLSEDELMLVAVITEKIKPADVDGDS